MEERLQKILARVGLGSRRACEKLIADGKISVNGQLAVLGMKADPAKDRIEVNGRPIEASEALKYIALYKPRNIISAAQPSPSGPQDDRRTVRDLVEEPGRLYPVGRLDVDSEGLIILTNDGDFTNRLTHPKYGHEKEYKVLVARRPDDKQLTAWRNGIVLEDGYRTKPAKVQVTGTHGKGAWLQVILKEGRKRQIREMGRLTGLPIVRIIRIRIGTLWLGNMKPSQWRHLTAEEIGELKHGKYQPKRQPKRGKYSKRHR
ncbi:MAG: rRNA pseudouridine synthase [Chloroflexi bacterium]|nr:rRNA pseudouridine synthase [Chloroflexota bacterium]